jgi:hypothetical protein
MPLSSAVHNGAIQQWVVVRPEPPGQFTARALGLADIFATAVTKEETLARVRAIMADLLASGQLVAIDVPWQNPLLSWSGRADPNDPNEKAYLDELARLRQEDLERTLRELDQECSNSSSTPTT